mgnify:FL=1
MKFNLWLSEKLKKLGLTQRKLAEQAGVSPATVSRWLSGEFEPDLTNLRKINQVLGVPERELFLQLGLVGKDFFTLDEGEVMIPVLGNSIPCGKPGGELEECIEGYEVFKRSLLPFPVSDSSLDGIRSYLIHAKGDSMQGDGIRNGDRVLFSPDLEARSGDIVIAYIEDEGFTIKRIFFQNSTVILQASNPAFPPIVVQPGIQEIRIIGKVIMHIGFH